VERRLSHAETFHITSRPGRSLRTTAPAIVMTQHPTPNTACGHPQVQRLILRITAVISLIVLPAVLLPRLAAEKVSWFMGFGQPPMTPLLLYMMAGGSCVFVGQAVLMWVMSMDVERHQPLIRVMAWGYLICGPLFLWIDSQAGLPKWWVAMDSTGCLAAGIALMWACYSRSKSS
jgi:hypothetical protein